MSITALQFLNFCHLKFPLDYNLTLYSHFHPFFSFHFFWFLIFQFLDTSKGVFPYQPDPLFISLSAYSPVNFPPEAFALVHCCVTNWFHPR